MTEPSAVLNPQDLSIDELYVVRKRYEALKLCNVQSGAQVATNTTRE